MRLHATREDEIDHLLRNEILVDLYAVVRQALRISQPSYSIKKVEAFYMEQRDTEVAEGGDSIIAFEEFLETGDRSLLEAIERYNDDDCRSTWLLRDWLLERRAEAKERFGCDIPWRPAPEPWQPDPEDAAELDALRGALVAGVPESPEDRARVGIASSSHAAIHNLLAEVERFAGEDPGWHGRKKHSGTLESRYRSPREASLIENCDRIDDFTDPDCRLVAGTAWLFAREELDGTLDYLFIDEAGGLCAARTSTTGGGCNLKRAARPLR